jgi:hypothetical protein
MNRIPLELHDEMPFVEQIAEYIETLTKEGRRPVALFGHIRDIANTRATLSPNRLMERAGPDGHYYATIDGVLIIPTHYAPRDKMFPVSRWPEAFAPWPWEDGR